MGSATIGKVSLLSYDVPIIRPGTDAAIRLRVRPDHHHGWNVSWTAAAPILEALRGQALSPVARLHQGGLAVLIFRLGLGPVLEQHVDAVHVAELGGVVERPQKPDAAPDFLEPPAEMKEAPT